MGEASGGSDSVSSPYISLTFSSSALCFGEKSLGCSFHDQNKVVHQTHRNGVSSVVHSSFKRETVNDSSGNAIYLNAFLKCFHLSHFTPAILDRLSIMLGFRFSFYNTCTIATAKATSGLIQTAVTNDRLTATSLHHAQARC